MARGWYAQCWAHDNHGEMTIDQARAPFVLGPRGVGLECRCELTLLVASCRSGRGMVGADRQAPTAAYRNGRLRALLDGPLTVLLPENLVALSVRLLHVLDVLSPQPWRAYLQRRRLYDYGRTGGGRRTRGVGGCVWGGGGGRPLGHAI